MNRGPETGKLPGPRGRASSCHVAGDRQHRDDQREAPEEHAEAERERVEHRVIGRVRREPRERAAVVAGGGAEGIEHLAQAVRVGLPRCARDVGRGNVEDPGAPDLARDAEAANSKIKNAGIRI